MIPSLFGWLAPLARRIVSVVDTPGDEGRDAAKEDPKADSKAEKNSAVDHYTARLDGAVENLRSTARWIVTIFAALATVLLAGTQFSSIGKLGATDYRLWIAVIAGGLVLVAIGIVIWFALSVLTTSSRSLDELARDSSAAEDVTFLKGSGLLEHGETIATFKDRSATLVAQRDTIDKGKDPAKWNDINTAIAYQNQRIHLYQVTMRYHAVRQAMAKAKKPSLAAGFFGGMAIGAFVWAANPSDPVADKAPFLTPTNAIADLSDDNKEKWEAELGTACVQNPIKVIVTHADDKNAQIVTLESDTCSVQQFQVSLDELSPANAVQID